MIEPGKSYPLLLVESGELRHGPQGLADVVAKGCGALHIAGLRGDSC